MAHVGIRQDTVKRPPTLWNACCSLARDAQPDAEWRDITKEYAPPIYERVNKRTRSESDDETRRAAEERLKTLTERHNAQLVPKLPGKSKKGVQAEVTRVLNSVETQLQTLNAAYNVEYALFAARSKRDARYAPAVIASRTAQSYFTNELRREVNSIVLDFEGYCVYGAEAAVHRAGKPASIKHNISSTLTEQLCALTGSETSRISWASPDALARTHGVILTGWPEHIPFQNMSNMRKGPAMEIWELVKDGKIRYERVDRSTDQARTGDASQNSTSVANNSSDARGMQTPPGQGGGAVLYTSSSPFAQPVLLGPGTRTADASDLLPARVIQSPAQAFASNNMPTSGSQYERLQEHMGSARSVHGTPMALEQTFAHTPHPPAFAPISSPRQDTPPIYLPFPPFNSFPSDSVDLQQVAPVFPSSTLPSMFSEHTASNPYGPA